MKITGGNIELPATASSQSPNPSPDSDLLQRHPGSRKPSRRRIRSSGAGVRLRKDLSVTPAGRRSRPQTPLLRWKFDEEVEVSNNGFDAQEESLGRKSHLRTRAPFSARKLAAGIWRLQLPVVPCDGENLGFQGGAGHSTSPFYSHHHHSKTQDSQVSESIESPRSISGPRTRPFTEMEGATKWDPITWKVTLLEEELAQAQAHIQHLETEHQTYKKKTEQFLKKLSEERSARHEKIRTVESELTRERKARQRAESVNSKLVNELADARVAVKRCVQEYEKERRTRELIEEVCDELAREIREDKAEVEAARRESEKLLEEVDEERRMLQMAEVWREERVQMKLVDAKVALEERYSQLNRLVAELESAVRNPDVDEIKRLVSAIAVHDVPELSGFPGEDGGSEWETVGSTDVSEVCSTPAQRMMSRDGEDDVSGRGRKGCMEWPRNSAQRKMESQKIQLRHVLKQKI